MTTDALYRPEKHRAWPWRRKSCSCIPDALQAVGNSKADSQEDLGANGARMSSQQISSVLLLLVGLVALMTSLGTAWALSRFVRAGRSESAWLLTTVSAMVFLLGVALSWF